jgi:Protein of unknown function (DUF3147)
MDLLWRFLLGGLAVSTFALIGDVVRPRRFGGLFAAAPSVALATLALTASHSGRPLASVEARSMVLSGLAFVLYACVVRGALARRAWPVWAVTFAALGVWGIGALIAAALLSAYDSLG